MARSPTFRTGVFPSGEIAVNQSGLLERSTSTRSNGTAFSVSAITALCTYGQSLWLINVSSCIAQTHSCLQHRSRRRAGIAQHLRQSEMPDTPNRLGEL